MFMGWGVCIELLEALRGRYAAEVDGSCGLAGDEAIPGTDHRGPASGT